MIRAAHDFALCTRRPQSCSLHATCARAQLGSANNARQRWCAPLFTGEACDIYHPFEPSRITAANSDNFPARNEDRAESWVKTAGAGLSSAPVSPTSSRPASASNCAPLACSTSNPPPAVPTGVRLNVTPEAQNTAADTAGT